MVRIDLEKACWYRGSSLAERARGGYLPETATRESGDERRAASRMSRWMGYAPFSDDHLFDQRLRSIGLTREDARLLMGESERALARRFSKPPAWLEDLARIYDSCRGENGHQQSPHLSRNDFLTIAQPIIRFARRELGERLARLDPTLRRPFDPETIVEILFKGQSGHLYDMVSRTLIQEINVARVEERLEGDTTKERIKNFFTRLRDRGAQVSLLEEYPVLARLLVTYMSQWVEVSLEFLAHLGADWDDICHTFGFENGDTLSAVRETGNRHRGGRTVRVLEFQSGRKLVYKPRSIEVDLHFQQLLQWLNQRADGPGFHAPVHLPVRGHGWVAFQEHRDCADRQQAQRYYQRLGGLLAILHALCAKDFHYGNLIAAGEHPVLIDLEALFQGSARNLDDHNGSEVAGSFLESSVLRTGLLPQRIWARQGYENIDFSGPAPSAGSQVSSKTLFIEKDKGEEIAVAAREVSLKGENRVRIAGRDADPLEFRKAFIAGFTRTYRTLLEHREALLAVDGPLSRFADDEVRVTVRATRTYDRLLEDCRHPNVLRDGIDRDQLLDQLWNRIPAREEMAPLVASEQADLWAGDIPIFTTRPSSTHIRDSRGRLIHHFFPETSLQKVMRQIQMLAEDDLERQRWFIEASYSMLEPVGHLGNLKRRRNLPRDVPANGEELLQAARDVGDRLHQLALFNDSGQISWVGVVEQKSQHWHIAPLSIELYSGISGVLFFLTYLGAVTGEAKYRIFARGVLRTFQLQLAHMTAASPPEGAFPVGAFQGWGGLIYCLAHLGSLQRDPVLIEKAHRLVPFLLRDLPHDRKFDIIGGAAGALAGLLALHAVRPSAELLHAASRCGHFLLAKADPVSGLWIGEDMAGRPLTGFGQGAAGIAWALRQLARLTGDDRLERGAASALAFERARFVAAADNWRDPRRSTEDSETHGNNAADGTRFMHGHDEGTRFVHDDDGTRFVHAWCHGAPGIGLSRLGMLTGTADEALAAEVQAAVRTTLAAGFGRGHCLCHGDLGNLELLLQASRSSLAPQLAPDLPSVTYGLAKGMLDCMAREGRICGVPQAVETPGLMTGIAGIGYQFLRLYDPASVPSVLSLAPPRRQIG